MANDHSDAAKGFQGRDRSRSIGVHRNVAARDRGTSCCSAGFSRRSLCSSSSGIFARPSSPPLAIPTSIIAAFALIAAFGYTLNQMTMLALTLMVGIVIDDAIVVLENIYRFVEEKGMHPFQAAIEGTREIGLAVLATTLSLLAVFLPVGFMGGIVGRFMSSFGLTAAAAIAVSLLVSFTLTPMLAARWIPSIGGARERRKAVTARHSSKQSRFYAPVDRTVHPDARMVDGPSVPSL